MRHGLAGWAGPVLAGLVMAACPAMAQGDDPMEMQRCVWRCLADAGSADSPA